MSLVHDFTSFHLAKGDTSKKFWGVLVAIDGRSCVCEALHMFDAFLQGSEVNIREAG